ncbi:MAG: PIN domain-containing protein [Candidatus Korarchaeota archaeon]|nr:PIN domain-containing protein [Candidatus Korarchaeota archaeon]
MALILDTRFLIAYTFPPTERDREKLREFVVRRAGEGFVIPAVVVAEFIKVAGRRLGSEAAEVKLKVWISSGAKVEPIDERVALEAGRMTLARGVPLADALVAAVAKSTRGIVVSDDPHFRVLGVKATWYK